MQTNMELPKKVFISYCWTDQEHQNKVIELANKLTHNGIVVKIDVWDLKPGHDTYAFMEEMVRDETIDKVLIICDKGYKEKADSRSGGVGTETAIITSEVYGKAKQEKFIPVIFEKKPKDFKAYIPIYAKGLLGIDMTVEEKYLESFEELLRCIYEKPRYKRPKLGSMPSFLNDEIPQIGVGLKLKNDEIKKLISQGRNNEIYMVSSEFIDEFLSEMETYRNDNSDKEKCINYFDEMKKLRDEYLDFLLSLIKILDGEEIVEIVVDFFEKLYAFREFNGTGVYNIYAVGHYSLLIHELFLWTNTLLLEYKKYQVIGDILNSKYYVDTKFGDRKKNFSCFYDEMCTMDTYKTAETKRVSLDADKLIERSTFNKKIYKEQLVEMDLIIYYSACIEDDTSKRWFPKLYIYREWYTKIKLLEKMSSKKYFEKVKCIFNVKDSKEFKDKAKHTFNNKKMPGYSNTFGSIPNLLYHFEDVEKVGEE